MGWWHIGIMDGDSPLDAKQKILQLLGFHDEEEPSNADLRTALDSNQLEVLSTFKEDEFENFIPIQVLGFLIVTTGAKLEIQTKQAVLEALSNDDWLEEDRQHELAKFEKIIQTYKGIAVDIPQTGLLDQIGNVDDDE